MPTNKPHFSIVMDEELLKIVEDYQARNGIRSRGRAINRLLDAGVAAVLEETEKAAPSASADRAAHSGDTVKMLTRALTRLGVIQDGGDISDADYRFIDAMLTAMEAHFQKQEKGGE